MAWTYDASLLDPDTAIGRRTIVRLVIGDTATGDQLLQDEEIDYFLSKQADSTRWASVDSVKAILGKFARLADTWMGHTRIELSQRTRHYRQLLETLETSSADMTVQILLGSESVADGQARDQETDRKQPSFKLGQDDISDQSTSLGDG